MPNKKIFILLPDGIGLRNFAFSNFQKIGIEKNFDITYWNNTPFDLTTLGFNEIKIKKAKSNPLTDSYKNARKHIEINLNIKKENDPVYHTYRFPFSYKKIKPALKNLLSLFLITFYSSTKGLEKVRKRILKLESSTSYFNECLETLQDQKPDFVFCTNQRPVLAIAPLLAAKKMNIPTATFIFSWDNLPKATMVVETDFYFVWSEHMKKELLHYYPYISEKQIIITGTPQFENHFESNLRVAKEQFYKEHQLDLNKKYICYSGDDITTCPDDPQYLSDVAEAVRKLNVKGYSLAILFRRCPVDFSNRFDTVIANYPDIIMPITPLWERIGQGWNTILPTKADVILQTNTILHTEMVINLGSSMVFDYAAYKKPCAFINYDVKAKIDKNWSVSKIYNYVHFRSMTNKNAVIWLGSANEIADKIEFGLQHPQHTIEDAKTWFEIINQHPPQEASKRIWEAIKTIISKE
ncbi:UDP-glycosyltransferase [Flavobacterium cheongpyeongense]|uniref:UDP-glycosyltransferase n=1 Tax=Flavobacterium cheongpyeongense TaxID=2212651 RepID=A0A2V4BSE9_9FLAO|nr:UDP-glycosyltransferase [Flavobacterium cheongpyeongense]PXY42016.1 UDP-glycosyltransferase [Flavobacterium cheongpyeongense]